MNTKLEIEILKSEKLRIEISNFFYLLVLFYWAIMGSFFNPENYFIKFNLSFFRIQFPIVIACIIYFSFIRYKIKQTLVSKIKFSSYWNYISTIIEITVPSILILTFSIEYNFSILSLFTPPSLVYFLFISLSILKLDPKICILAGILSFLQYLSLAFYFRTEISENEIGIFISNISLHRSKAGLLFLAGLISSFVAFQIRTRVSNSLELIEEKNQIQKELLDSQISYSKDLEENVKQRTSELNKTLAIIQADLLVAKKIQINTLLSDFHLSEELNIFPFYKPMSEVGGDYYSITKISDFNYRIFLSDATGHGVQAALITMAIKGLYDNIKDLPIATNEIMQMFNEDFQNRYGSLKTYLTCILVDINTKEGKLKYTSAGHPSCILVKEDNMFHLSKTGKMIGIKRNLSYNEIEFNFERGNHLFLFTDGAFEEFNSNKEEFGEDRLYSILSKEGGIFPEKRILNLMQELESFLDGVNIQDDITILGISFR